MWIVVATYEDRFESDRTLVRVGPFDSFEKAYEAGYEIRARLGEESVEEHRISTHCLRVDVYESMSDLFEDREFRAKVKKMEDGL